MTEANWKRAGLSDLMRQGLATFRAPIGKPAAPPVVACDACQNWHRQGKHTADAKTRRANLAILRNYATRKPADPCAAREECDGSCAHNRDCPAR